MRAHSFADGCLLKKVESRPPKFASGSALLIICCLVASCSTPSTRTRTPGRMIESVNPPRLETVDKEQARLAVALSDRSEWERKRAVSGISDPELLFQVVMLTTTYPDDACNEALSRIKDVHLLKKIIETHSLANWRRNAERRLETVRIQARLTVVAGIANETALRDIVLDDKEAFEVRRRALSRLTRPQYLVEIAKNQSISYRPLNGYAAEKLTDQTLLLEVALESDRQGAGFAALRRLEPTGLVQVAMSAQSEHVAGSAVQRIEQQAHLIQIARSAPAREVRIAAIGRLTHEPTLRYIATLGEHHWERLTAIAQTTDAALLKKLIERDGNEGKLAKLRLALLEIKPTPNMEVGFSTTSRNYQRLSRAGRRVGGIATLEGEYVQVRLNHPRESNRPVKHSAVFESKFPGIFKGGYVPAELHEWKLRGLLRGYLKSAVAAHTIRAIAESAEAEMLIEVAQSLVN